MGKLPPANGVFGLRVEWLEVHKRDPHRRLLGKSSVLLTLRVRKCLTRSVKSTFKKRRRPEDFHPRAAA
jgi:hypothetical protein